MAEVNLRTVECPNCGASVYLAKQQTSVFCSYCGKQMVIDDGVQRTEQHISGEVTIHHIDHIETERIKLEQEKLRLEKQKLASKWVPTLIWGAFCVLVFITLFLLFGPFEKQFHRASGIDYYDVQDLAPFVVPIVLVLTKPRKKKWAWIAWLFAFFFLTMVAVYM